MKRGCLVSEDGSGGKEKTEDSQTEEELNQSRILRGSLIFTRPTVIQPVIYYY